MIAAGAIAPKAGADTTWLNKADANWFTPANWSNGLPSVLQSAIFRSAGSVVSPNVGSLIANSAGVSIDNSGGGVYSINGNGTLVLGIGSLSISGGGSSTIAPSLTLTAPTSLSIGTNTTATLSGPLANGPVPFAVTKDGAGTLQLTATSSAVTNIMPLTINSGTVLARTDFCLGQSPQITVNAATLQIDLTTAGQSTYLGDDGSRTTLKNGSTIQGLGNATHDVGLYGVVAVDNGASTTITAPISSNAIGFFGQIQNKVSAPSGTTSVIHVPGVGVITLNAASTGNNAYTGSWDFNQTAPGAVGLTFLADPRALGVNTASGYAAPVVLSGGYLTDLASTSTRPVPNPITLNGGVLSSSFAGMGNHSSAYFSGAITLQGGSTIDMSDVSRALSSSTASSINLSGVVSGAADLFVTAPTLQASPVEGVLTLANTSTTTPNSQSGRMIVQWNAALSATSSTTGSNPLGSGTVLLAGGSLRLGHAGSGSNGTITTFANTNVALRGFSNSDAPSAPSSGGTILLNNTSSASTGNVVTLGRLTFDTTGTSSTQTLSVQNASAGVGYAAKFNGTITLAGTGTITTGGNPADVIFNGNVTGSGNLIKAGNNTLTLNGASSDYSGSTTVNGGTLVFNATHKLSLLTVNPGATAVVSAGRNKFLRTTSLQINSGTLDLTDEDAILPGGSAATVRGLLQTGYANGNWTGGGITSSAARAVAANPSQPPRTAIGYATATQLGVGSFDGQSVLGTDLLLRYTLAGDTNLDGKVNALDFNAVASNFGAGSGKVWTQGDLNYDGVVDTADFTRLATNFGGAISSPAVAAPLGTLVPEPAFLSIAVLIPLGLRRRRRS